VPAATGQIEIMNKENVKTIKLVLPARFAAQTAFSFVVISVWCVTPSNHASPAKAVDFLWLVV
jgi:hypothetical protein